MAEPAPRLEVAPAGAAPEYTPISGTAVASLIVAGFFVVILGVAALSAALSNDSLHEIWFFAFPILSVVLAFVARKQIDASEGTRTGISYANAGWWISVVVGVVYAAYLIGNQFTVRNDAERYFTGWAEKVKAIDPDDPSSKAIYEACVLTLPPAMQARKINPRDTDAMDQAFGADLARLRQLDVVRIAVRNKGEVEFIPLGLIEWEEGPRQINCTLSYTMRTPEGEFALRVPMQAAVLDGQRVWQILPMESGYVTSSSLTPYGWKVNQIDRDGRHEAQQFLANLASGPGGLQYAYIAFIKPGGDPTTAFKWFQPEAILAREAVIGGTAVLGVQAGGMDAVIGGPGFLTNFDGEPLTDAEHARFLRALMSGGVSPVSTSVVQSNVLEPVLDLDGDAVRMAYPAMVRLPGTGGYAQVRIVLQAVDPKESAKLKALRDRDGSPGEAPPPDIKSDVTRWRVIRIESDLQSLPAAAGPGGPPPG